MKPVANYLREKSLLSVVYLDDWLCFANTSKECTKNINLTRQILKFLGFIINEAKSCITPDTKCRFLEFILDLVSKTLALPEDKRIQILNLIRELRTLKSCTIRKFSQVVVSITAACLAINYGWLYSKALERQKYLALLKNNRNYDSIMKIPCFLLTDFDWWEKHISTSNNPIRQHKFALEIFSHASLKRRRMQWRDYSWSLE